jgi:hypothetical protein
MKYARSAGLCGLVATMMTMAALAGPESTDSVSVKLVTYGQLGRLIRDLKGKVILVDFWAHW